MKATFFLLFAGFAVAFAWVDRDFEKCDKQYKDFRYVCPFNPCDAVDCHLSGTNCRNYYCGGCHAIWFDRNGEYCHECSNYFMLLQKRNESKKMAVENQNNKNNNDKKNNNKNNKSKSKAKAKTTKKTH